MQGEYLCQYLQRTALLLNSPFAFFDAMEHHHAIFPVSLLLLTGLDVLW